MENDNQGSSLCHIDNDKEYFEDSDDSCKDPDYVPGSSDEGETAFGVSQLSSGQGLETKPCDNEVSEQEESENRGMIIENESEKVRSIKRQQNVGLSDTKRLSRKRRQEPESWKMNINKALCQTGQEYQDVRGNIRQARCLKTIKNCEANCKYQCSKKISHHEREDIFRGFWALSSDAKLHFHAKNTERITEVRKQTSKIDSRRQYSYKYYFHVNDQKIRICKTFFLSTIDVSQQRINYFHIKKKDEVTGIPAPLQQGRHPKKTVSAISKEYVHLHINQIPRVESHYCRLDTKKEYFDVTLNMNKLYSLYLEFCVGKQIDPVKIHTYRYIFNYEYNIDFLKPKKDRCNTCEEYELKKSGMSDAERCILERHLPGKQAAKQNRDLDRRNEDYQTAVICFNLEKVFALPRCNISCFFYSRKLNTFNLTVHCNLQKQAYCCIWSEGTHGRQESDIASALIEILSKVIADFPHIKRIILWSDSCVPQNKNSVMSTALMKFLQQHPTIDEIVQKFGEPGHSNIQEVDNLHSQIERKLAGVDIFSPLGLLRLLPSVNQRKPFHVFHMTYKDFQLYKEASQKLNFKKVPYASLKQIKYSAKCPGKLFYKLCHDDQSYIEAPIIHRNRTRNSGICTTLIMLPDIRPAPEPKSSLLPFARVVDLSKLFKFMPEVDITFIKTFFKQYNDPALFEKEMKKFKNK